MKINTNYSDLGVRAEVMGLVATVVSMMADWHTVILVLFMLNEMI